MLPVIVVRLCAYDDGSGELDEIVSSGEWPQMVRVLGHYWNGLGVMENEPATLVYFNNRLYDYKSQDEIMEE